MSKHTPGPWNVHQSYVYAPDGAIIAVIHNPGNKESDYPLVENRNLISAAPDLLEALKELAKEEFRDDDDTILAKARQRARAAIAKAEGKE